LKRKKKKKEKKKKRKKKKEKKKKKKDKEEKGRKKKKKEKKKRGGGRGGGRPTSLAYQWCSELLITRSNAGNVCARLAFRREGRRDSVRKERKRRGLKAKNFLESK